MVSTLSKFHFINGEILGMRPHYTSVVYRRSGNETTLH